DARRPRLRQGAPGGAVVSRPARRRCDGRGSAGLMINLETPRKFSGLIAQAHQVAAEVFRPNSRRYDREEHAYPKELDMLAAAIDGLAEGGGISGAGAAGVRRDGDAGSDGAPVRNGSNMSTCLSIMELGWGDVGLLLSMPRQ